MSMTRIDCHPLGGVAGDMFAAAMFDACPHLHAAFNTDLAALGIHGLSTLLGDGVSNGLAGKQFSVQQATSAKPPRTFNEVVQFIDARALDAELTRTAKAIYHRLAEAEAAVHGKTVESVHFHEVSDWDSMMDIVAAAGIISRLPEVSWRIGPLPLGGGTVRTAHGEIPVPAPATAHLLRDFDWLDDGLPGERVTPTGAAILAYLKPLKLDSEAAAARLTSVGVGCGTRALAGKANIFRVCVFSESESNSRDWVTHLAFEIDDMTGEEMAQALDRLRDLPGVLDVSTVAMQGKKGRPSTGFRLLVFPENEHEITQQCFTQTTTLGVRCALVQRRVLERDASSVDGYRVKTARRPDATQTVKIESDELTPLDSLHARRARARHIEARACDE